MGNSAPAVWDQSNAFVNREAMQCGRGEGTPKHFVVTGAGGCSGV